MTPIETKFLIWACVTMFGALGFITSFFLYRLTQTLDILSKDVQGIKEEIAKITESHEGQEKINDSFEKRFEKIEDKLFI